MSSDPDVLKSAAAEPADELILAGDDPDSEIHLKLKGWRQKTAEIRFKGDYEGFYVKVWINCPRKLLSKLGTEGPEGDKALAAFIVDHNLVYEDGSRLPNPLTPQALDAIDVILMNRIVKLGGEAIQKASGIDPQ